VRRKKAKWDERVVGDGRFDPAAEVVVRSIADVRTGAKVIVDDLLFDGLDLLHCDEGRFRFSFRDHAAVVLEPGEVMALYPGRYVTVEALEKDNRLVYGIFGGRDVETFFDVLGCFDFMRGKTELHYASILQLREMVESPKALEYDWRHTWMSFLADIVTSQVNEMRTASSSQLMFDAVRLIQSNVRKGIVRIEPLCDKLKISRVYLHRLFVEAGLGSPSENICGLQLRQARRLLADPSLEIAEVAKRAGFVSAAHFSTFIRQQTGSTPTALRRNQLRGH